MRKKLMGLFFFIMAAAIVLCMFIFSSQNGDDSGGLSRDVSRFLAERLSPSFWRSAGTAAREGVLDFMDHPVRKTAHFTEYAVLGAFLMGGFMCLRFSMPLRALFSLLICLAAAGADEYHQKFVTGRAGEVADVLLDTAGAVFGILAVAVICMAVMYTVGSVRLKRGASGRGGKRKRPQYRAAPPPDGGGTGFGI